MKANTILAVLATGLSFAMADEADITTTSTQTITKTLTITKCNPTNTACPYYSANSTSSAWYPIANSTSYAYPTGSVASTTAYVMPTPSTQSSAGYPAPSSTAATTTGPAKVGANAAGGLYVQTGLLLGVVAAGVALLA